MLTGINRIFYIAEERKDISILFWILIGPIFVVMTLFLTSFSQVPNKDLYLLAILGVGLLWKKRQRGLFYSLFFLSIITFLKHFQISYNHFWQFGIEISLSLGFVITNYAFEHVSEFLSSIDNFKVQNLEDIEKLKAELQKEEDFHKRQHKNFKYEIDSINLQIEEKKQEINSYKGLVENLRNTISEADRNKTALMEKVKEKEKILNAYRQEIEDLKSHITSISDQEQLYQKNKNLLDQLNKVRTEKEQNHCINQSLVKMLSKETDLRKIKEQEIQDILKKESTSHSKVNVLEEENKKLQNSIELLKQKLEKEADKKALKVNPKAILNDNSLISKYEKKFQELRKIESLYNQLRMQFEEKKQVLSDTRKELFMTQEKLFSHEREKQLEALDEPEAIKELNDQIANFEKEITKLEEENIELQALVTQLSNHE